MRLKLETDGYVRDAETGDCYGEPETWRSDLFNCLCDTSQDREFNYPKKVVDAVVVLLESGHIVELS